MAASRLYPRAVRRAFATVPVYREQWARAGRPLAEPEPTATRDLPDPPHTLCPFRRPWSPADEPPPWTPAPVALARALRLAGCGGGIPVLEVRAALLDRTRLPRAGLAARRAPYGVLLAPDAVVASPARRRELDGAALALATAAGAAWVVGHPDELATLPGMADGRLRPVHRLPVNAAAVSAAAGGHVPVLLHDPVLGYLGALVPDCGGLHLDARRVYARDRAGAVAFSLPRNRRPTLLDIVPPGAEAVTVDRCPRHGNPVLRPR